MKYNRIEGKITKQYLIPLWASGIQCGNWCDLKPTSQLRKLLARGILLSDKTENLRFVLIVTWLQTTTFSADEGIKLCFNTRNYQDFVKFSGIKFVCLNNFYKDHKVMKAPAEVRFELHWSTFIQTVIFLNIKIKHWLFKLYKLIL